MFGFSAAAARWQGAKEKAAASSATKIRRNLRGMFIWWF
jgi:hypothetical protein